MRKILFIVFFVFEIICYSQNKDFFLIDDSIPFSELSINDSTLLLNTLTEYHNTKEELKKLELINSLYKNLDHTIWQKYTLWLEVEINLYLNKHPSDSLANYIQSCVFNNYGVMYEEIIDSSLKYNYLSIELRKKYAPNELAANYYNIANAFENNNQHDSALKYYSISLMYDKKYDNQYEVSYTLNNLAILYEKMGNLEKATELHIQSMKIKEKNGYEEELSNTYNNLGWIYQEENEFELAEEYLLKSIEINTKLNNSIKSGQPYLTLGHIELIKKDTIKAIKYYNESMAYFQKELNEEGIALVYLNYSSIYEARNILDSAEYLLNKALSIYEKHNNISGMSWSLEGLANVNFKRGNYKKAIQLGEKSYEYARSDNFPYEIRDIAFILYNTYKKDNQPIKALYFYEVYIEMRDIVLNDKNKSAMIKQEMSYKHEKEKIAIQKEQERKDDIAQLQKERQQLILILVSIGLVILFVFLIILFNRFKFIRNQKLIIEEKTKEITASINYAKRIQQAVLPEIELNDLFIDSFLLYKPKDIVSGDFYWWEKRGDIKYIAVADCTGHGVPGGFMSMLGTLFLNEIFNSKKLSKPSEILDELNRLVQITLKDRFGNNIKDGMDISFACLNTVTLELEWAGANNPLYIQKNNQIQIIKGDRKPIGFSHVTTPFQNYKVQLEKRDSIYLFSDGYPDQFGGPKSKKIGYSIFRDKLIEFSSLKIDKQKNELNSFFENWNGKEEQIDDVCVIGIRI